MEEKVPFLRATKKIDYSEINLKRNCKTYIKIENITEGHKRKFMK